MTTRAHTIGIRTSVRIVLDENVYRPDETRTDPAALEDPIKIGNATHQPLERGPRHRAQTFTEMSRVRRSVSGSTETTGATTDAAGRGALTEIIRDGGAGFVMDSVECTVEAVEKLGTIDRAARRANAQAHLGASVMADGCAAAYSALTSLS